MGSVLNSSLHPGAICKGPGQRSQQRRRGRRHTARRAPTMRHASRVQRAAPHLVALQPVKGRRRLLGIPKREVSQPAAPHLSRHHCRGIGSGEVQARCDSAGMDSEQCCAAPQAACISGVCRPLPNAAWQLTRQPHAGAALLERSQALGLGARGHACHHHLCRPGDHARECTRFECSLYRGGCRAACWACRNQT